MIELTCLLTLIMVAAYLAASNTKFRDMLLTILAGIWVAVWILVILFLVLLAALGIFFAAYGQQPWWLAAALPFALWFAWLAVAARKVPV